MYRFDGAEEKKQRIAKGLRLEKMAVALDRSVTQLVAYESGRADPPTIVVAKMCEVLGCKPGDLFTRARRQVSA